MINTHEIKRLTPIDQIKHERLPLFEALKAYEESNVTSFDVPGHKRGLDKNYLLNYYGSRTLRHDVNSMPSLDNLDHPVSVIKEAQSLMADLFLADEAHFLVNGTTGGIQAMILTVCKPGDKLIVPRNVHKSVLNAMALADVNPVYVSPQFDSEFGIAHNITAQSVREALKQHPDARAVFIMNPTYFGAVSDLKAVVEAAHEHRIPVLVDEAHGAHFRFSNELPYSSMEAGADMAATSMHKTGGSFTQSSVLLIKGDLIDHHKVKSVINMLTSTSASYLLMSSLDIARHHLAMHGTEKISDMLQKVRQFRTELNQINGFHMLNPEHFKTDYAQQMDETKLTIYIDHNLPLSGFEIYSILRNDYSIQMELSEPNIIMGIASFYDNEEVLSHLLSALKSISEAHYKENEDFEPPTLRQVGIPERKMGLRDVFYAEKKKVPLVSALNEICAESLMIYPPGIPIVMAGELITQEVIEYWQYVNSQPIIKIGGENKNEVYIVDHKKEK